MSTKRYIRILGYAVVDDDFDARFSCLYREYKYFFNLGSMDLGLIKEAAEKLIGEHDFRNFCKRDEGKVKDGQEQNFMRKILSIGNLLVTLFRIEFFLSFYLFYQIYWLIYLIMI